MTSVERPNRPCLSLVNRSPVIFILSNCCCDIHSLHVDALIPDIEVIDRLPSEALDLAGGLSEKTGTPLFGFDKPITGDIRSLHTDVPIPDGTEVRGRSP